MRRNNRKRQCIKKMTTALLALLLIGTVLTPAFASAEGLTDFCVNPYGGEQQALDTVHWQMVGDTYRLFLPADIDFDNAKIYFTASAAVSLDGNVIDSGSGASTLAGAGTHTLTCGGTSCSLEILQSENIPAMFIETESGSLAYLHASKENTEKAAIRIYENGELLLDDTLKQIKGRGNSTWTWPKKPYNIKFDKKTDLFGMGKAKKWSLLASYNESTLLRNPAGWMMAEALGLLYTSHFRHVDLFINGEYQGNYILCESVEVGDNRVEINDLDKANEKANPDLDLEKLPQVGNGKNGAVPNGFTKNGKKWIDIPNDPEDISGGYLMEFELQARFGDELCGFITSNGQPVTLKSPEFATKAEVDYISAYVDAALRALSDPTGKNKEGKHYSEYFDMESLVNMYILQEYAMNFDSGLTSFYVFKQAGDEKLYCSPIWDLDSAFGLRVSRYGASLRNAGLWFANELNYHNAHSILGLAWQQADFRSAVEKRWQEINAANMIQDEILRISELAAQTRASAVMEALLWNSFHTDQTDAVGEAVDADREDMLAYMAERQTNLNNGFSANSAWLSYDLNGAEGANYGFFTPICLKGESVTVLDAVGAGYITPPEDAQFLQSWNTKPDGSGSTYYPGDQITLTDDVTVLYAVWGSEPRTEADAARIPGTVTGLKAEATGDGEITLTWQPAEKATRYNVFLLNNATKQYVYLKNASTESCTVNGLVDSETYTFKVRAVATETLMSIFGGFSDAVSAVAVNNCGDGHAWGVWKPLDDETHRRVCGNNHAHTEQEPHVWDAGTVSVPASCAANGEKTFTCTVCQATRLEEIPALGHTAVVDAAVPATCTTDGKTEGSHCSVCNAVIKAQETVAATGHSYGAWAKLDDVQHQRVCANDNTHVEKEDHKWDGGTVTQAATCTEKGVKEYACAVCQATKTEEIPALGHTAVVDAAVPATCTTDGKTEGSHCSVCNAVIKAQETVAATDHSYGEWTKLDDAQHQRICANDNTHVEKEDHKWDGGTVTQAATCTEKGVKEYACAVCQATKTEEIPALGHTAVVDAAVPATCTTDGKTEGSHCSVCNAVIKAQETVAATGHSYGEWTKLDDAQHQRICANDNSHVETENHTWNEGEVTKAATYTEAGITTFTCIVCGATKTEPIPKTPVPIIDADNAKEIDDNVFTVPDMTVKDLLALAGDGATITKADGKALTEKDTVGSGMTLTKPDGTKLTVIVKGDNDGDGRVSAADARLALRRSVSLESFADWQTAASLVSGGDKVTSADARLILRASVGLEKLPLA